MSNICLDQTCNVELVQTKDKSFDGWGFLGVIYIHILECPKCKKEYQEIQIIDEEASPENRSKSIPLKLREIPDELLEKAKDSSFFSAWIYA